MAMQTSRAYCVTPRNVAATRSMRQRVCAAPCRSAPAVGKTLVFDPSRRYGSSVDGSARPPPLDPQTQARFARLTSNPFADKYKAQVEVIKAEVEAGHRSLAALPPVERLQPLPMAASAANGAGLPEQQKHTSPARLPPMTGPRTLDHIMRVQMLQALELDEIAALWLAYHTQKETVSAVIPSASWKMMAERAKASPMFLHPLARPGGYEMFLSQFAHNQWAFTSLIEYKTHQDNATPRLLLNHFTDLHATKHAVLMAAELEKPLTVADAHVLAHQIQIFYGGSADDHALVQRFNHSPAAFDHNSVIERVQALLDVTRKADAVFDAAE